MAMTQRRGAKHGTSRFRGCIELQLLFHFSSPID